MTATVGGFRALIVAVCAIAAVLAIPPAAAVAAEFEAQVTIVGGNGAISEDVADFVGFAVGEDPDRIAGSDRYETAASISARTFPDGAAIAFVASGLNFPDALVAVPAAIEAGGPVLLSHPHGVPQATADELARIGPERIVVLGGEGALSTAVFTRLETLAPTVERLAGVDRFGTAAALSAEFFPSGVPVAYIADAFTYAEVLAAGPVAAAHHGPILLTGSELPAATVAELTRLQPQSIVVLGGTSRVSASIEQQVAAFTSGSVLRIGRDDPYESAAAIVASTGYAGEAVILARGDDFADGLAAGPLSAKLSAPILLTHSAWVPFATKRAIADTLPGVQPALEAPLKAGSSGPAVSALQELLTAKKFYRGSITGRYDAATQQAVMAFHKATRKTRTFSMLDGDWEAIAAYVPQGLPNRSHQSNRIEVDIRRQVLYLFENGQLAAVMPVSSGNGELYTGPSGSLSRASTPRGNFRIQRHIKGWRISYLGALWNPWYFTGGYAIHGSRSVPAYPASHGCIRLTMWDSDWIEARLRIGLPLNVWG